MDFVGRPRRAAAAAPAALLAALLVCAARAGLPSAGDVDAEALRGLDGRRLRVGAIVKAPFVVFDPDRKGNAQYSGVSIDQIKKIAQDFNMELEFVPLTGTYDNMVVSVGNGSAGVDISVQLITTTARRVLIADHVDSPLDSSFSYVMRKENVFSNSFKGVFSPFADSLWILIFCVLLGLSLLQTFFMPPQSRDTKRKLFKRMCSSLYTLTSLLLGQLSDNPRQPQVRLLRIAWELFTLGLTAIFTANLASFFTQERAGGKIWGTRAFGDGSAPVELSRLVLAAGTSMKSHVDQTLKSWATFSPDYMLCESGAECIAMVLDGRADATLYDDAYLDHVLNNEGNCRKLEKIGPSGAPHATTWVLPKDSNLTRPLSLAILNSRADGSFEKIFNSYVDKGLCGRQNSLADSQVGPEQLFAFYIMILLFVSMAIAYHIYDRVVLAKRDLTGLGPADVARKDSQNSEGS